MGNKESQPPNAENMQPYTIVVIGPFGNNQDNP